MNIAGVRAVYGIGSVGAPGISDLDLVVVFEDGVTAPLDLRQELSPNDKYILIHSLYGASESQFLLSPSYSFFHPYRLLAGQELLSSCPPADASVRRQVAMEYLLKFYITLKLQQAYKMIRVRSVLLNAKGAMIDLNYLSPDNHELESFSRELTVLRNNWFVNSDSLQEFQSWFHRFSSWYFNFVEEKFLSLPFFLPDSRSYQLSKNIFIHHGQQLHAKHSGSIFPFLYPLLGKRYFNMLNRINRLDIFVPIRSEGWPSPIVDYFRFGSEHRTYNRLHLPHYLPLASSLHLK